MEVHVDICRHLDAFIRESLGFELVCEEIEYTWCHVLVRNKTPSSNCDHLDGCLGIYGPVERCSRPMLIVDDMDKEVVPSARALKRV